MNNCESLQCPVGLREGNISTSHSDNVVNILVLKPHREIIEKKECCLDAVNATTVTLSDSTMFAKTLCNYVFCLHLGVLFSVIQIMVQG